VTKAQEPLVERLAKVEQSPETGGPVIAITAAVNAQTPDVAKAELLARADAADRDGHSIYAEGLRDRASRLPAA
jgi:hypothetical protein